MKSIAFFLFCIAALCESLNAQSRKDERYKVTLESIRKGVDEEKEDDFRHYEVHYVSDTIFTQFARRKIKATFKKAGRLTSHLVSMLNDEYFERYEKESSSQKTCGYYIETNPALFNSYSIFIKKNNIIIDRLTRMLKNDHNLINIKIYTGANEFIIANEFFKYDGVFQPKTIDDLRLKRNITSLCVLCWSNDVDYGNTIKNFSKSKIGFAESKYLTQIACPVISDDRYMCDILFTYLN